MVTLRVSHGSWIPAIGEAPRCAVESSGENREGGLVSGQAMAMRDAMPSTGSDNHALMMQAVQRPTPAAISDVTCPPGKLYARRARAPLEGHRFRGVDGGTCLAVAHWGAESAWCRPAWEG